MHNHQIPDPKLLKEIATKIQTMATEGIYEISLESPFEKMKIYHEDSRDLSDSIKRGAVIFSVEDTKSVVHTFYLF